MGKILILANNDIGLYKFRKELIQELLKDNEVFISLPDGEFIVDFVNMGCKFIDTKINRRGINPLRDFKLMIDYNKIFRCLRPDLVITYTIKPNIYGGFISRIKKVIHVANVTGLGSVFQNKGLLMKIIITMYKISLKESKIIFFENENNKSVFIDYGIIQVEKGYKLNGAGVNLVEYPYSNYPTEFKNIRFLFIGRIMKEKGIEELFKVIKILKLQNNNVVFDIVGPEEDEYLERLRKLEDEGFITYYGYQKDVKPFISRSHCIVLPSYHEGMANTLLEAGSMGRPLIASNIPGCREAVIDGYNGYLVNVKDSKDLYIKLQKFIELDHEKKENMGIKSREHISTIFDKKKIILKTMNEMMR